MDDEEGADSDPALIAPGRKPPAQLGSFRKSGGRDGEAHVHESTSLREPR